MNPHPLSPDLSRLALAMLVVLIATTVSGCASYRTVRIAHNGGDTPPFTEKTADSILNLEQVGPGDTVALVQGGYNRLLRSNETSVHLLERGKEVQSEQSPSKSQRKGESSNTEDKRSKSQRKAEDEKDKRSKSQRKADSDDKGGSKNHSKGVDKGPSKSESKQPHAQIQLAKYVRLGNVADVPTHQNRLTYSIAVRHHEDPDNVIYSVTLGNWGDADYQGAVSIVDHLPEGLEFVTTRSILSRSQNSVKMAMAFIPIIGLYTSILLSDYSDTAIQPASIGLTDLSRGSLVHYEIPSLKIPHGEQVVFDFLVKITHW